MNHDARAAGHFHAVRFFNDSESLCRIVAAFLADGFAKGEAAVVIAVPEHAAAIEDCLRQDGLDVSSLKRLGDLVMLDAREALETFMADGMPDPGAFRHNIGGVIAQVSRGHGNCAVRAYGEMVNLLWKDGLEASAIRLETLWNDLSSTHEFKLLCGYSMGHFYKGTSLDDIKGQHSHLTSDAGDHAAIN